jgi:hypothetical protein
MSEGRPLWPRPDGEAVYLRFFLRFPFLQDFFLCFFFASEAE